MKCFLKLFLLNLIFVNCTKKQFYSYEQTKAISKGLYISSYMKTLGLNCKSLFVKKKVLCRKFAVKIKTKFYKKENTKVLYTNLFFDPKTKRLLEKKAKMIVFPKFWKFKYIVEKSKKINWKILKINKNLLIKSIFLHLLCIFYINMLNFIPYVLKAALKFFKLLKVFRRCYKTLQNKAIFLYLCVF